VRARERAAKIKKAKEITSKEKSEKKHLKELIFKEKHVKKKEKLAKKAAERDRKKKAAAAKEKLAKKAAERDEKKARERKKKIKIAKEKSAKEARKEKRAKAMGKITGVVKTAADSKPVGGMTVRLVGGGDTVHTKTDKKGRFSVDLPRFVRYTITASKSGWISARTNFRPVAKTSKLALPVTQSMPHGEMRIVLGWGKHPQDLDLHVLVPPTKTKAQGDDDLAGRSESSDKHHEISWEGTGNKKKAPYAVLENDQTNGYGPETIHTYKNIKGMYYVYVDSYSTKNYKVFKHSHAHVNVFSGNKQIFQGDIAFSKKFPAKYWHVLNMDCRNASDKKHCKIIKVNKFLDKPPKPK